MMDLAMKTWLKEDALRDYVKSYCPAVDEFIMRHTREPRLWKCDCGWEGIPERTHNSGGATNYKYCPRCKNSIYLSLVEIK